jgi:hypothetical protein
MNEKVLQKTNTIAIKKLLLDQLVHLIRLI